MDIEEAGRAPESVAAELHRQLGDIGPRVPVHEIALALDIVSIRNGPLTSFEGCLLTNPERTDGEILVNRNSSPQRRRYTIAHELGHYLMTWHEQIDATGFRCTRQDMIRTQATSGHSNQEVEANRFAIELLAPARCFARYRRLLPDLEHVLRLSNELDISREAAARRYVELHPQPSAVIFAKEGTCLYVNRGQNFPWIGLQKDDRIPELPSPSVGSTSDFLEADPRDWLLGTSGDLGVQVLSQQDGYAIILLSVDQADDEDTIESASLRW